MSGFENPSLDKLYGEPIIFMVDGDEYKMNRIRMKDISAVYARIRDNRIKAVMRNWGAPGCDADMMARAIAHVACIDPTQEDYISYADTTAGFVYIMWRGLVPNHPRITEDKVAVLIEREGGLKDMFFAESGITRPEPPKDPDAEGENRDPLPVFGDRQAAKNTPKPQAI